MHRESFGLWLGGQTRPTGIASVRHGRYAEQSTLFPICYLYWRCASPVAWRNAGLCVGRPNQEQMSSHAAPHVHVQSRLKIEGVLRALEAIDVL